MAAVSVFRQGQENNGNRPAVPTAHYAGQMLNHYPDGAGVQADVFRAERGEFGPAKASEGSRQDQRPV